MAKEKLESKAVRSVRKRVATLDELLGRPVEMDVVKDALTEGVKTTFGIEVEIGEPTAWELEKARILWETKYTTEAWNLGPCRRCPCRTELDRRLLRSVVSAE